MAVQNVEHGFVDLVVVSPMGEPPSRRLHRIAFVIRKSSAGAGVRLARVAAATVRAIQAGGIDVCKMIDAFRT